MPSMPRMHWLPDWGGDGRGGGPEGSGGTEGGTEEEGGGKDRRDGGDEGEEMRLESKVDGLHKT